MANLDVSKLDFDDIKSSLKEYLQSQDKFKDYDFEGSNLSILLDILAYNTHYNQLYANFALNEVFLDSAAKRDSVVSIAKAIGYTPRSSSCAKAIVDINVTNVSSAAPNILILQSGSRFITNVDGEDYTFTTIKPYTAELDSGTYTFSNVELLQGELLTNTYVYNDNSRIIIPNLGCDLSTLRIKVRTSSTSSDFEIYNSVKNITESSYDSLVYYVKEIENGLYEIYFGENVIGKQPSNGNIINIEYMSCDADLPNGAKLFTYNGQSLANGLVTVITIEEAGSGKDRESIESIRLNSPNLYSAQNRAVNAKDYESIIINNVPNIDSVTVWGGEDNIPPVYGKVFISVKPASRDKLSSQEEKSIASLLRSKQVIAITPEFVDPDLLYIIVESNVYYNPATTNKNDSDIEILVRQTLSDFNFAYLNSVNGQYKHSILTTRIDKSDKSIINNSTNIKLIKKIKPNINITYSDSIMIHNGIEYVISSPFYVSDELSQVYFKSFGSSLILCKLGPNGEEQIKNTGTLNLDNGTIDISNIVITSTTNADNSIDFVIQPKQNDVLSKLNQIMTIDVAKSVINVIQNSDNYIFTSNRI